ncbi:uncharacterized protein LOC141526472 [Cotesia typhae]|uniref:uncharacterized protein LOC141526472 n=1 Tax=Cotesia typhae TaxID=2053667 RepID=UPI003D68493D
MSCSVKISSKGWASSQQRRIGSLPEETNVLLSQPASPANPGSTVISTPIVIGTTTQVLIPQQQQLLLQQHQQQTLKTVQSKALAKSIATKKGEDTVKLLKYIDDNIIGKNGTFFGPFGRRKVIYCDYTATGRSLQFLEEYITKEVLPCLGDTRASTSICSLQSSLFRHEARDIIRHAVGAGEQDAVLFTGHGTDDVLRTLLRHLDVPRRPTVVFVGPFEHRTNLRPWRELGTKVVRIAETKEGFLDLNDLERKLIEEKSSERMMVGCFNAASCITGVLADDVATTLLLHQYGALSVWDYTSAAPYVHMDMNPHLPGVGETAVYKDAIIFSGHKFVGGAQSPGVLVVKRSLLKNDIAIEDMRDSHRYLKDPELRDESGTAGIVGSIRCGLAMQLKENVTTQAIISRQEKISKQVLAHVRTIPELILLGSNFQNIKRLPVFSFMVRHPRGTFLHHNFVCAILNDVFGIQARSGCACAGRYAHDLMGIGIDLAKKYNSILTDKSSNPESNAEVLRPGFARLSLPYFTTEAELAFVLEALKMVATEGWKLLPQYVLNPDTGEWRHHTNSVFKERKWLGSIRYTDGKMIASERRVSGGGGVFPQSYADCLQTARNIFNRSRKMAHRFPLQMDCNVTFTAVGESLRWFILPSEAQDLLLGNSQNVKQDLPFDPAVRKHRRDFTLGINNSGIRRLNSDIPRSANPPLAIASPRHNSLPALSSDPHAPPLNRSGDSFDSTTSEEKPTLAICKNSFSISSLSSIHSHPGQKSSTDSPLPTIKFAVGEAVTSSMIIATTPAGARLMAGEHSMPQYVNASNSHRGNRTRCNSLGSSGKTMPVPIPLSPQTLASLGVVASTAGNLPRNHRYCSCSSSRIDLSSSLELDGGIGNSPTRSPGSSATSSPTSSSSPSPHPYTQAFNSHQMSHQHAHHPGLVIPETHKLGRCSPIISSFSQSSDDDLRAYLKEVTKELATEIKSEIREVISKVDDVLSDNGTPQHHNQRAAVMASERQYQKDDSCSAREVAEYLMEFSKGMASEVKSEIRCMVNQVDGLGRFSPDLHSTASTGSPGYGTPERRLPSSPLAGLKLAKTSKLSDLQQSQQESKMSSECSSDETVIYVVGPRVAPTNQTTTSTTNRERSKTSDEEDDEEVQVNKKLTKNVIKKITGNSTKTLPEIYSAVNSVSSQDSGINLSFNDNDVRSTELGRSSSSSSGSSSTDSCGIISSSNTTSKKPKSTPIKGPRRSKNIEKSKETRKLPDDLSEDEFSLPIPDKILTSDDDEFVEKKSGFEQDDKEDDEDDDKPGEGESRWYSPPKNMWKATVEAIHEFDMIRDKDRVLVCLPATTTGARVAAGGYGLALLHALHQYQFYARSKNIDFEIGAVTIDANSSYDSIEANSVSYLKGLKVPYFYEEAEEQASLIDAVNNSSVDLASDKTVPGRVCTTCGRVGVSMRKRLYSVAKRYGFNVLALGHHLDDLTEGFLTAFFYSGKLKTMKAHYYVKEHDLRVVRPFVYVREKSLKQFTEEKKLPMLRVVCQSCNEVNEVVSKNNKELMVQQEKKYPKVYWSVRNALRPLILARENFGHGYQRHKHKLKLKVSPSHPSPHTSTGLLTTYQELGNSDTDEQIF